jgi:4-aminobutyrate aminotransferase-like enzyme
MTGPYTRPKIRIAVLLLLALLVAAPAPVEARRRSRQPTRSKLAKPIRGQAPKGSLLGLGRAIDPNHPLRRQVKPEALLRATLGLLGGGDVATLPRHVRTALSKQVKKSQRSLRKRKTQMALIDTLKRQVGEQQFEKVAGSQAAGLKAALSKLDEGRGWGPTDSHDMQRGWGWQLLPKGDKAFSDPTFLARMLRESGQTGHGMVHNEPSRAIDVFRSAWSKIAPNNVRPEAFALTGSDANNLLYSVALVAAQRRLGKREIKSAEILYFDGVYAGGRGKIGGASFLPYGKDGAPNLEAYKIASPHTPQFGRITKAEVKRLEKIEAQALQQIEKKVTSQTGKPIGGLLIEPMLGAKGVYFYRPEFLLKLRTLCDKLKIPIMADEILTGGGRTGKFFAYQHYKGFEPDFVTFGKGLQVAGVATVRRDAPRDAKGKPVWDKRPPSYSMPRGMTTLSAYSEPLLKGAQVMTRIHDGKLMQNAARVGKRIVTKLKAYAKAHPSDYRDKEGPPRGMGLLIFSRVRPDRVMDAMGRLMPPLTLSQQQADQIFAEKNLR